MKACEKNFTFTQTLNYQKKFALALLHLSETKERHL